MAGSCSLLLVLFFLGQLNYATSKNREMGRPFAFRWLPFDGGTQQPTKSWCKRWITGGDDGGQGDNRGLGRYPIVWAVKFSGKTNQNREMGGPLALDGRHSMEGHNNQPKVVGSNMIQLGLIARWMIRLGWGVIPSFRPSN